jgi:hypothetical protein
MVRTDPPGKGGAKSSCFSDPNWHFWLIKQGRDENGDIFAHWAVTWERYTSDWNILMVRTKFA